MTLWKMVIVLLYNTMTEKTENSLVTLECLLYCYKIMIKTFSFCD